MNTEKCDWLAKHFEEGEMKAREDAAKFLALAEEYRRLKEKYRKPVRVPIPAIANWHCWCNPLARA